MGPTKNQLEYLVNSLQNGYVCGNSINNDYAFYVKRQLRCGDYIEYQYYNPKYGVKGNMIVTEDICSICYDDEDIFQQKKPMTSLMLVDITHSQYADIALM